MLKTNLGRRIIFNQRLPMLLPRVEEIMEMGEMMMMMMEMKMVQTYHLIFLRSPTSRTRFDSILNLPRGGTEVEMEMEMMTVMKMEMMMMMGMIFLNLIRILLIIHLMMMRICIFPLVDFEIWIHQRIRFPHSQHSRNK